MTYIYDLKKLDSVVFVLRTVLCILHDIVRRSIVVPVPYSATGRPSLLVHESDEGRKCATNDS